MNRSPKITEFIEALQQSLTDGTFVKVTMGNYRGSDKALKSIIIRRIAVKSGEKLSFTYRNLTNDIVKNFSFGESLDLIGELLQSGFHIATLFTTSFDLIVEMFHKNFRIRRTKPTQSTLPTTSHDQQKKRLITTEKAGYLYDLKITDEHGKVLAGGQDKYRQINKYIEILSTLLSALPADKPLRIADMGSGKGYLTFALYDYLVNTMSRPAEITGVEFRNELVTLCNDIAQKCGFQHLAFRQGTIEQYDPGAIDILIALHACDTATDEALFRGIRANASLIVVAPCCHKQIRKQMEQSQAANELDFLTRHGILLERQAEMVTDAMRALILEFSGYKTRIFEFISDVHTPKNVMITAVRTSRSKKDMKLIYNKIQEVKSYFGIEYHHLEKLLNI